MTTQTPRTDAIWLNWFGEPVDAMENEEAIRKGLYAPLCKIERDLAAAQAELAAVGSHVGGGAFYRDEHGGRLPMSGQVAQHVTELNQQLATAQEARERAEALAAQNERDSEEVSDATHFDEAIDAARAK